MAGPARQMHYQLVHFLRKRVNFNDAGISTGVILGTLPAGAQITKVSANVITAFNAGTTNVLTVGTVGTAYNNLAAAGDIDETSATYQEGVAATYGSVEFAVDTDVYIKYVQTGTAATTGQADVFLTYIPNTDG